MIYYETAGIVVSWDSLDSWIEVMGRGHISDQEFAEYQVVIKPLLARGEVRAILLDVANVYAITPAMQHKMNTETIPDFISGGILYIAIIIPYRVTALQSVQPLVEAAFAQGMALQFFIEKPAAQEWLSRIQPQA